ncbi:MAG: lysostaphin resistance A-like protein [Planctomycetaceae bacterium]
MLDLTNRYEFLTAAILFEGGLLAVAGVIGWACDIDPVARHRFAADGWGWGVAATLPMLALFQVLYSLPWQPAQRIRHILLEVLGPSLAACRWYDLALLAGVAGLGEEVLFRGVLQPLLGLFWSNVLFGLLHPLSVLYLALATGMGLYLGWLLETTDNLLAPIVTHALYDFLAFLLVARDFRRRATAGLPVDAPGR